MCSAGTSVSNAGKRIFTRREMEVLSLALSRTLSNRYLVNDFSSSLWYAVRMQDRRSTSEMSIAAIVLISMRSVFVYLRLRLFRQSLVCSGFMIKVVRHFSSKKPENVVTVVSGCFKSCFYAVCRIGADCSQQRFKQNLSLRTVNTIYEIISHENNWL